MQPYEPSAESNASTSMNAVGVHNLDGPKKSASERHLRAWPVWIISIASLWCLFGPTLIGAPDSIRFGTLALGAVAQCLAMLAWVLFGSRVRWLSRFAMLGIGLGVVIVAFAFQDSTLGISILLYGIPIAIICLSVVLLLTARVSWSTRRWLTMFSWGVPILAWLLFRSEGFMASFMPQIRPRWTENSEQLAERSLKEKANRSVPASLPEQVTLQTGDWPRFRGVANDGQSTQETLVVSDKLKAKELWRLRSGPSWGSVIVVDGLLFTLEQRGNDEVVVCLNATTGGEIWTHAYPARFEDQTSVSGAGPRGTPTFYNGRIYTVGGLGNVTALNATDGSRIWARDLMKDTSGNVPMWGISTSPYLTDTTCYVLSSTEGTDGTSTIAYDAQTGEIQQNMGFGGSTYSSIQLLTIGGVQQILSSVSRMKGDDAGQKLIGFDRTTNQELWRYEGKGSGNCMLTPISVGANRVLLVDGSQGATLLEVTCEGAPKDEPTDGPAAGKELRWKTEKLWSENKMLPEFSDVVFQNGLVLGISKNLLTAVDAESGKLLWKKLRFGGGQLIGLAQQNAVLAVSEQGEMSLVQIDKKEPKELLKWEALNGKTWNHPIVVGNRIFCRNSEEIVAYELSE